MEGSAIDDVDAGVEVDLISIDADGERVVTDHTPSLGSTVGGTRPHVVGATAVSIMAERVRSALCSGIGRYRR